MGEGTRLGELLALGLHRHVDACSEIVDRAQKELTVEKVGGYTMAGVWVWVEVERRSQGRCQGAYLGGRNSSITGGMAGHIPYGPPRIELDRLLFPLSPPHRPPTPAPPGRRCARSRRRGASCASPSRPPPRPTAPRCRA